MSDPSQPSRSRGDYGAPGRFEWEQTDHVRRLRVSGEVDISNARHVMDVLSRMGERDLVIDLTRVDFMDSTGLGMLVELESRAPGDCELVVRPGSQVDRLLRLTGLDEHFTIAPPEQDQGSSTV